MKGKKKLKILLNDGDVDLEVTDLIFYDFYKQCQFIGRFNLSREIGLEGAVEGTQDMTMVFKCHRITSSQWRLSRKKLWGEA